MKPETKERVANVAGPAAVVTLGFCISELPLWRMILAAAAFVVVTLVYRWRATTTVDKVRDMLIAAMKGEAP